MNKYTFVFVLFIGFVLAIDESPIASFACQLCSAGNPLANEILPEGMTCLDLDTAMKNIGRSGCFGLAGSTNEGGSGEPDKNNATQTWEAYQKKSAELEEEKAYSNRLLIAVIVLSVCIPLICIAAGIIVWILFKKSNDDSVQEFYNSQAHFPVDHTTLKLL